MALDDFAGRSRSLSDADRNEEDNEPLELDDETYGAADDEDTGEFVDDEDEEEEELPPTMHLHKGDLSGEEKEEKDEFSEAEPA